jgi:hypothetical protein
MPLQLAETQQARIVEQKWPTNLVLVRHGESERNVLKEAAKIAGQTESYAIGVRDIDGGYEFMKRPARHPPFLRGYSFGLAKPLPGITIPGLQI